MTSLTQGRVYEKKILCDAMLQSREFFFISQGNGSMNVAVSPKVNRCTLDICRGSANLICVQEVLCS